MRLDALPRTVDAPLSPGEVHFLWWFIQGSIMEPETRRRLSRAWGMCERHGVGALAAEAAFRHGYLHGPAILYADLMARAARAFELAGPFAGERLARRLRSRGPCLMCELGFGPDSESFISRERVEAGRDLSHIRALLTRLERHWRGTVCGRCAGSRAQPRCRVHLIEELGNDPFLDLEPHRSLVYSILEHVERYDASFRWEMQGSDTAEDRASLVSAAGWCSGWGALLSCVERPYRGQA